ncbi:MAG: (2Fe-2S) ferredoxin domain-containing protein, partial [Christensenella sp.]
MIHNVKELNKFKNQYKKSLDAQYKKILVCGGTGCVAGGSLDIYERLKELAQKRGLPVSVELKQEPHEEIAFKKSGCHGFCEMGPLLRIDPQGWLY